MGIPSFSLEYERCQSTLPWQQTFSLHSVSFDLTNYMYVCLTISLYLRYIAICLLQQYELSLIFPTLFDLTKPDIAGKLHSKGGASQVER